MRIFYPSFLSVWPIFSLGLPSSSLPPDLLLLARFLNDALYQSPYPFREDTVPEYPERSPCLRFLESSNGAKFQERLIWFDEKWLFSSIKPLKCKVYIFHYVPLLCPLSTKREVNVVNNALLSFFKISLNLCLFLSAKLHYCRPGVNFSFPSCPFSDLAPFSITYRLD